MPVKVLARDKNELRLRFVGESHTSLQVLREKLNADDRVDYANYFPGHPDLDDPEFYVRVNGKSSQKKFSRILLITWKNNSQSYPCEAVLCLDSCLMPKK